MQKHHLHSSSRGSFQSFKLYWRNANYENGSDFMEKGRTSVLIGNFDNNDFGLQVFKRFFPYFFFLFF